MIFLKRHFTYRGLLAVIFSILLYYGIQLLTKILKLYPYLGLPEEWTQHGNWVQLTEHHLWQMLLALILIGIFSKGRWDRWGLNLQNNRESLRYIKMFLWFYGLYFIGIGFLLQYFFVPKPIPPFPVTSANIIGMISFLILLSGLSEEILFRGMMQTLLQRYIKGFWEWNKIKMPIAGWIIAVIFALVHINFRIFPFEITHLYYPQVALAFVLGLFYATYHKTGSLLAPIVTHNISNGLLYISNLMLWVLK